MFSSQDRILPQIENGGMKKIQSSYTYEDLIISGEESLFGPGNAKLPLPPMLMLDRILKISDEGGAYDKGEILSLIHI